jgi:hypothetical protein
MASVAVSNISAVNYNNSKISVSGFAIEHFRIAAGQTAGDTAVLTPIREKLIKGVLGPVVNNLPTTGTGATSVTVTLALVQGTAITSTIGQVDVFLICFPR